MSQQDTQSISRRDIFRIAAAGLVTAGGASFLSPAFAGHHDSTPPLTAAEIAAIDAAIGKKGKWIDAEAVYTVALPRADLHVSIKGDPVPTSFGFGGWMSIKRTMNGKSAMLMGDTVLLQEEVNPLISAAQAQGLEISAIHNHFFYLDPVVFYVHVHGMGEPADLATRYAAAIQSSKVSPANQPPAGPPPAHTAKDIFDIPALDAIIGATGNVNGATYKYVIGRKDLKVTAMGVELTPNIGLNTWAAFTGAADQAHIAGDVAMLASEVNPVIAALRKNDLEVVAVHSHMLTESPRIFFLHYYGTGPATTLARGFRAAIDELGAHGTGREVASGHDYHGKPDMRG